MEEALKQLNEKIDGLKSEMTDLMAKAEQSDSAEEIAEFKAMLEGTEEQPGIKQQLDALTQEREERIKEFEFKSMKSTVTTLSEAIEELKKPAGNFMIGGKAADDLNNPSAADPYSNGEYSFYRDILAANKGRQEAIQRLTDGLGVEGKAMSEGVAAQGGYLVQASIERQIVEARELDNVMRALCTKLNVTTNQLDLTQIGLATTAGWVAELAAKPETTSMSLSTVSASVFTAAGLATISNQLLADSNPAVDALVTADLAKRLVALEEAAFISGTGTGQPLGLLNTPGIGSTTLTLTDPGVDGGLLDSILDAINSVQTNWGNPTAILMHPRTWTRILKDKNSAGVYTFAMPSNAVNNDYTAPRTLQNGPAQTLWGVPVVLSNRVPTNLGAGTNESRVIVGDFAEALILDRQGITVDESPHVYFTTNQTVFRAEQRVGFTAARQPLAFNVIGGVGLASG